MVMIDAPRVEEMPQDEEATNFSADVGGTLVTRRGDEATVDFYPGAAQVSGSDTETHSANLVDFLSEQEQSELANKIIDWVEIDIESRKDWDERLGQAVELLGLKNIPLEDLPFDGASAVTYPLIGEAVVNFQARAIEEIFPSEGPVKTKIVGEVTREKEEQAERIKNHMNYQILDQDRSYFWHTDSMLFYLPLGGSAFKKTYWDTVAEMTVSPFVQPTDFIIPYMATDLASSPRYTHRMYKNESEMKKLFESGFWKEVDLQMQQPLTGNESAGQELRDTADDRTASMHADDSIYTVYETHCDLEFDFDQETYGRKSPLPYVATVDLESRKLMSLRRNWKEGDKRCKKRVWFTHYKYLPGLGFYGFGLLHFIGSVAESASGSIRALLDSAAFANMQGGFMSNDAKLEDGDNRITPGLYKGTNMTAEELSRAFYTPPFKEPSQALVNLFQLLVESGKSFSSSTEVLTGEAKNTGPVGTTIALIEQGSKPLSAIHRRLHMAAAEEFSLRAELNYEFLPDQYPYKVEDAESVIMREDYDGRVDVIPVSDPNIFSSTQRIAQAQALIERSMQAPDLYNRMEVEERFLRAIRVPDYEELLAKQEKVRLDPISENMAMLQGRGANAFLDQDHDAHLAAHITFLEGLNEVALEMMGPIMQSHLSEHYAFKYWNDMNAQLGGQLPQPGEFGPENPLPPEVDQELAQMAASIPEIDIMPPMPDDEGDSFEAEEARKDEAHLNEQRRKDEAAIADMRRKDLDALSKEDREDWIAEQKAKREEQEAAAKKRREDMLAAAKAQREAKAAKAKPKPKA